MNLLHKAGGRVVYFVKEHQRKVEKFFYLQRKVERAGLKRKKNEYSKYKNQKAIFQCHEEKDPIKSI